jgi:sulfur carrier protein
VITLNGETRDVPAGTTVEQLLAELEAGPRGVAIAVDAEVVPRGEWPTYLIPDGASVEVVHAVQGG